MWTCTKLARPPIFFWMGLVFAEALKAKVKKVVFAASGCVYPNFLQSDTKKEIYLTEGLTKGPNDADNTYGWAKLMGEFTLQAYAKEHGLGAASCRYFTVYGPAEPRCGQLARQETTWLGTKGSLSRGAEAHY
jgi:nucleoside-diphosphate-sugar epimerase